MVDNMAISVDLLVGVDSEGGGNGGRRAGTEAAAGFDQVHMCLQHL